MKLKEGMYVRLNCNYELGIGKTIREIDEDNFIKAKFKDDFECSVPMYMISKASHNIIDLIEVGDYVNGKKVIDTFTDYIFDYSEDFKVIRFSETDILHDVKHIKSIVTKEQFESIEYNLEG